MASGPLTKIFANCDRTDFAARDTELASILAYIDGWENSGALILSCEPGSGTSELLRQAADELWSRDGKVVPFYFRFSRTESSSDAARRFAYEFILQTVAFLRRRPSLFLTSPSTDELRSIALPRDTAWIEDLQRSIGEFRGDPINSLERLCLSTPFRAAAAGTMSVLLLDGFHDAGELADTFAASLERSSIPFIAAGNRRGLSGRLTGKRIDIDRPEFAKASQVAAAIAKRRGVEINDECRDLIAAQCGGNLVMVDAWITDAADHRVSLNSFQAAEQVYAESVFGGRISRHFDNVFAAVASDALETQRTILGLISDSGPSDEGGIPIELWERRIDAKPKRVRRMIEQLNVNELIDTDSQSVRINARDIVLQDYIEKRTKLEFEGANRAIVFGGSLGSYIKRAPRLMADVYRREASIGLRELLLAFNAAEVPTALIDYAIFKAELKGEPDDVMLDKIGAASSFVRLPKVFFAGDALAIQHSLSDIAINGLTAFAMGFNETTQEGENTVWIAAEIESKLEATKDLAEFWCDRLEEAALKCGTLNFRLWLIAPEGFSTDALVMLRQRNAFGSSRKQVDLLKHFLSADDGAQLETGGDEYEFVLPMDQDAELIAARAIEDIAKRHNMEPKAVNQIKTALVEAYINASEHSLSPDRKIYQKVRIDDEKIEITISNRGVRLEDKSAKVVEFEQGRRGWGLKLMRQLMDEVRVESVDDGTRITMTKYLKPRVPDAVAG